MNPGLRVALRGAVLRVAALHQAGADRRAGRVGGARAPHDGAQRDGHADGEQGLHGAPRSHIHRPEPKSILYLLLTSFVHGTGISPSFHLLP